MNKTRTLKRTGNANCNLSHN